MATGPELEIQSAGISYRCGCSICKAETPLMKSKGASAEELLKWYAIRFAFHREDHHKKHFQGNY